MQRRFVIVRFWSHESLVVLVGHESQVTNQAIHHQPRTLPPTEPSPAGHRTPASCHSTIPLPQSHLIQEISQIRPPQCSRRGHRDERSCFDGVRGPKGWNHCERLVRLSWHPHHCCSPTQEPRSGITNPRPTEVAFNTFNAVSCLRNPSFRHRPTIFQQM